jgi:PAS domain-containing protein
VDSFCQYVLHSPKEVLVVTDALLDSRFKNSSLVEGNPNIRFYAGVSLETSKGHVLGTLCIIDTKPREISSNQQKALQMLAKKVMDYFDMRKLLIEQKDEIESNAIKLKKLTDNVPLWVFQSRMSNDGRMNFEFVSKGTEELFPLKNFDESNSYGIRFDMIHPDDLEEFQVQVAESFNNLSVLYVEYRIISENEYKWFQIKGNPEKQSDGSVVWYGFCQNINSRVQYEAAMEQIAFDISHVLRKPVANLLGLNNLMESERNITKKRLLEYMGYVKDVSQELESFTHDLNKIYYDKKLIICDHKNRY